MLIVASSFSVVDSHTAGHPTRVILSGIPSLRGESVLEKREDFRARFDRLRAQLLHEPRGHAAMVGLVPLSSRVADFGAFFMSSYVYLDMCGHGTIGYARTLAASGRSGPTGVNSRSNTGRHRDGRARVGRCRSARGGAAAQRAEPCGARGRRGAGRRVRRDPRGHRLRGHVVCARRCRRARARARAGSGFRAAQARQHPQAGDRAGARRPARIRRRSDAERPLLRPKRDRRTPSICWCSTSTSSTARPAAPGPRRVLPSSCGAAGSLRAATTGPATFSASPSWPAWPRSGPIAPSSPRSKASRISRPSRPSWSRPAIH